MKLIIGFFMLLNTAVYAQQEQQFTQFNDNMLYYNPAYAGSREMLNITALHRQQWMGYQGAPMTTTLSAHTPLKYQNFGIGLSLINDRIGPTNGTTINADASYTLRFKKHNGKLSFGLKGGLNILNGDLSSLTKKDVSDSYLNTRYQNEIQPNIGAGVYYQSTQWFVGFSIPKIVQSIQQASDIQYLDKRHYYFTVGGYMAVNRMLKLRPSAMLKVTENAPLALDGSLAFIFYDRLWLGGNYRLQESGAVFAQYQISNQFKIGYAFELATTKLRKYNAGTHEILLSYDLLFKKESLSSPRYF